MGKPKAKAIPFPSKQEVLAFIRESPTPPNRREIARAFAVRGADRTALRQLLKELQEEGLLERGHKRQLKAPGALPEVAVVEVIGPDADGELLARPAAWRHEREPPVIYMAPERRGHPALAAGERALARLTRIEVDRYEGRTIRVLAGAPRRLLGFYRVADRGGRLQPTDRRVKTEFALSREDAAGAKPGELVLAEVKPHHPRLGLRDVRVVERLGRGEGIHALSLIAIHEHGLPTEFSSDELAEAAAAGPVSLGKRDDLRDLPLVTIDGADARDFDDAVWAEPGPDSRNLGGWHLVVAIADVAHYVSPGGALDRCAHERGNSAYFPDRVVPMLPEALSNGWCSLKPGEDRPCLAVHLWIDASGNPRGHRFVRGLMRSAARLTYEQVQAGHDGRADGAARGLLARLLPPLYGAYHALLAARERRGTLDLDLPEPRILLDGEGGIAGIEPRSRLDSHRLIEEFMIAANVAAAKTLESKRQACMYRLHAPPDPVKVEALRQLLDSLGLRLARGQAMRPRVFMQILRKASQTPYAAMINEVVLRTQSQAVYSPENIGHFGLALTRYAHFTSPIRRYADLLIHRALIAGLGLGADGLRPEQASKFAEIGEHISMTERRAAAAERDAVDRFTAAFLQDKIGQIFPGRINGVTRFGLFVTLDGTGVDGLVPIRTLPDDYYDHVEADHCLVGRRWGRMYRLGEEVQARLVEADPVTGSVVLSLLDHNGDSMGGRDPVGGRKRTKSAKGPDRRAARGKKCGAERIQRDQPRRRAPKRRRSAMSAPNG